MNDTIENFGDSMIQHGKSNDRAYLMKVSPGDCPAVVNHAFKLAVANGYSKIFAKAGQCSSEAFLRRGFQEEAKVPGLFNGHEDGYFLSHFIHQQRSREDRPETVRKVLATAHGKHAEAVQKPGLAAEFSWCIMQKQDVHDMAALYRQVFASYPFPIDDSGYLASTMDEDVIYHGIRKDDELVALSSAEIDFAGQNVEMTDFATRPDCRGAGLATCLLDKMEQDVSRRGIRTAYTIARAYSYGMNITFARHGYRFAGTLANNTQIFGQLESMNVWYKAL